MKHVKKSVLLWYSAREMYELVTGVEAYPHFLPWCEKAEVLDRTDDAMTVRLHLHYAGLKHAFTTRNAHMPDRSVVMALVEGPFSLLDGTWLFHGIGEGAPPACRIEFDLRYAFNSRPLEAVLSPVFDRVANTFVDSFVKRAEQVYGSR
jgi:ribosome-associated toxin RatA of RatAB toxin-antitoxin module